MEKILKIEGKGKLRLHPDTICAELTLEGSEPSYPLTLGRAQKELEEVKGALSAAGFSDSSLKTSDFRIDTKYEGYRNEKGDWKQKFIGYQYTHALKMRFAADNTVLSLFVSALSSCRANPVFSFSYTVKDVEAAREALIRDAIKDCKKKAGIIASEAGTALAGIRQIDYAVGERDFSVRAVQPMRFRKTETDASDISLNASPDDIEVSDSVTVIWEME